MWLLAMACTPGMDDSDSPSASGWTAGAPFVLSAGFASGEDEDPALVQQDWATIRNTMWNYVGIVRTTERLGRAVADIRDLEKRLLRFYHETKMSKAIVDLFHGVHASYLIAQAALKNPVSRGCHYRKS